MSSSANGSSSRGGGGITAGNAVPNENGVYDDDEGAPSAAATAPVGANLPPESSRSSAPGPASKATSWLSPPCGFGSLHVSSPSHFSAASMGSAASITSTPHHGFASTSTAASFSSVFASPPASAPSGFASMTAAAAASTRGFASSSAAPGRDLASPPASAPRMSDSTSRAAYVSQTSPHGRPAMKPELASDMLNSTRKRAAQPNMPSDNPPASRQKQRVASSSIGSANNATSPPAKITLLEFGNDGIPPWFRTDSPNQEVSRLADLALACADNMCRLEKSRRSRGEVIRVWKRYIQKEIVSFLTHHGGSTPNHCSLLQLDGRRLPALAAYMNVSHNVHFPEFMAMVATYLEPFETFNLVKTASEQRVSPAVLSYGLVSSPLALLCLQAHSQRLSSCIL
jgi:hypothetical protein